MNQKHVDVVHSNIHFEQVAEVYASCDILIKSSSLESFSYPPLEMIATGGFAVVAANAGNIEYLESGRNCLLYELGDVNTAFDHVISLIENPELQQRLFENGLQTARDRDWNTISPTILEKYCSLIDG